MKASNSLRLNCPVDDPQTVCEGIYVPIRIRNGARDEGVQHAVIQLESDVVLQEAIREHVREMHPHLEVD